MHFAQPVTTIELGLWLLCGDNEANQEPIFLIELAWLWNLVCGLEIKDGQTRSLRHYDVVELSRELLTALKFSINVPWGPLECV